MTGLPTSACALLLLLAGALCVARALPVAARPVTQRRNERVRPATAAACCPVRPAQRL